MWVLALQYYFIYIEKWISESISLGFERGEERQNSPRTREFFFKDVNISEEDRGDKIHQGLESFLKMETFQRRIGGTKFTKDS